MIVPSLGDLKRAASLNGMAWSLMLMTGGAITGYVSAAVGVEFNAFTPKPG
jgi:hypothetical protein